MSLNSEICNELGSDYLKSVPHHHTLCRYEMRLTSPQYITPIKKLHWYLLVETKMSFTGSVGVPMTEL